MGFFAGRKPRSDQAASNTPQTEHERAMAGIMSMAIPTFVLDGEGRVALWNPACERLTGLKASEVLHTKDHWKGFYKEARPCLADLALTRDTAAIDRLYASQSRERTGDDLRAENWCDLPLGERRYLIIEACPMVDAAGKVVGVVETLQDATELEKARQEASEARLSQGKCVEALGAALKDLAEGRLTTRIDDPFEGDYDRLRVDFNEAVSQLRSAIGSVADKSRTIRLGCEELSTAADDFSRRVEEQAARVEEIAAALSEVNQAVRQTRDGTIEAKSTITGVRSDSSKTEAVVEQTVASMNAIEQSSKKVSQIIGVIDEIAFQTNLLALNAGVEAARAGEAGRGFAVVAHEVRGLAQRSAEAAKEIKSLISTSSDQVEEGVQLVGRTGEALQAMVAQIGRIDEIVANLASSAQDQATNLAEVDAGVQSIDQVTQQNAAMAEQSSAASRSVATETEELSHLLTSFDCGQAGASGESSKGPPVSEGLRAA
ncbi:methyl-accepting chemotaxis protein [Jiella marina]|uniref:methyl-accepting chemotaxis protein n=1 Tax=Jiella sp. LLJ827 TaxID=2917712 RepID=UPI002100F71A|nr:methyl-accepting chemotaxis protein [Jiella sp. LLJ827]MCQ0987672.1 methyl-accepting chemotaxis protein [Jiella sp. LLJ827]